jgi:hypothetical protein
MVDTSKKKSAGVEGKGKKKSGAEFEIFSLCSSSFAELSLKLQNLTA